MYVIPFPRFQVVDCNAPSLLSGQAAAAARGLAGRMRFVCGDFQTFAAGQKDNAAAARNNAPRLLDPSGQHQMSSHAAISSESTALAATLAAACSGEAAVESGAPAQLATAAAAALAPAAAGASVAARAFSFDNGPWARVDVVVALHACGSLTDHALAFAATHRAPFLVVPCCFHKRPVADGAAWQHEHRARRRFLAATGAANTSCLAPPANDNAVAKAEANSDSTAQPHAAQAAAEAADDAADAAHVESTVVRLAESDARAVSFRAMAAIGTLRLRACLRAAQINDGPCAQQFGEAPGRTGAGSEFEGPLQLSLEAFPQTFSLRNLVLVGERLSGGGSMGGLQGEKARCTDAHLF